MNKQPFKNPYFNIGFFTGIFLTFLANLYHDYYSYLASQEGEFLLSAGGYTSGIPFEMHKAGWGNPNHSSFIVSGVLGNSIVAILFGFALGLLFWYLSFHIPEFTKNKLR